MALVYLSLGSNMGDPIANLARAVEKLILLFRDHQTSGVYRTAPVDAPPQPDFYNLVLRGKYAGASAALLENIQRIEAGFGRTHEAPRGPRTMDIDILLHGTEVIHTPDLMIPHPRMEDRAFVLVPLADLEPNLILPSSRPIAERLGDPEIAAQRIEAYDLFPL